MPESNAGTTFTRSDIESLAAVDYASYRYEDACTVIHGIVSPNNQSVWSGGDDRREVHCFTIAAWRRVGGPIVNRDLAILRPISPQDELESMFPAFSVHAMCVLISTDGTRAVVARPVTLDEPDEELTAFASDLQNVLVKWNTAFGDLVLDRACGDFSGEAEWNGEMINVRFHVDDKNSIEDAIKTGESLWADQLLWKQRIEEFLIKQVLPLKNGQWLQDDETPLTEQEFLGQMDPPLMVMSGGGEFECWRDSEDLFWGHIIQVFGSLKDGLTSFALLG